MYEPHPWLSSALEAHIISADDGDGGKRFSA